MSFLTIYPLEVCSDNRVLGEGFIATYEASKWYPLKPYATPREQHGISCYFRGNA